MFVKIQNLQLKNFKGHLIVHYIDPESFDSINSLYTQCKSINSRFENIDLTEFGYDSSTFDINHFNENEIEKITIVIKQQIN